MPQWFFYITTLKQKIGYGARLIIIVSLHLLIIASSAFFVYHMSEKMEMDGGIINHSGMIRGGIQQVAKLETNGINATEQIRAIDALFAHFLITDKEQISRNTMDPFLHRLYHLRNEWNCLKELITRYRTHHDEKLKSAVIDQSETCWEVANDTVLLAEILSEAKFSMFQTLFFIFLIDVILIIAIIWLINSSVRHHLEKISRLDPLTGICNRNVFNETIRGEIEASKRYSTPFSLLILDIDFFKQINDTYGHDTGDRVLKELSNLIGRLVRKTDVLCRIGGEEFAIVLTRTDAKRAPRVGEKIRQEVENGDFNLNSNITISIGIATYQNGDTQESLFKRADEALYHSKENGRNRVSVPP